ncbi:MAG: serine/threonine-protein kinase [Planctomycetota bacterium]
MKSPPRVPGYAPLRLLGAGGMGAVWEVVQEATGQRYALKLVRAQGQEDLARFQREARVLAGLDHPNVVRLHTADFSARPPYFVQELLEGGSLSELLRRGPLPAASAREILRQVGEGVAAAHRAGILHRDLKPDNVLFSAEGVAKVTDFGLAVSGETRERLTRTGAVLGTPEYMAPEQALDARGADERADVYALGALLYAMLTGAPPIPANGRSLIALLTALQTEPPRPPSEFAPATPPELEQLCLRALAKDPEARFPTARALLEALERRSSGRGWGRRGAAAAALALAVALALGVWLSLPTRGAQEPAAAAPARVEPVPPAPRPRAVSEEGLRPGFELQPQGARREVLVDGDRLVVVGYEALAIYDGGSHRELSTVALEPSAEPERLVALGDERYAIAREEGPLLVVGPGERVTPVESLQSVLCVARHDQLLACGLRSGALQVLRIEDSGVTPLTEVLELAPKFQVEDVVWLDARHLVLATRGRRQENATAGTDRDNGSQLVLVVYDPTASGLLPVEWQDVFGAFSLAVHPSRPNLVVVGTALGGLHAFEVRDEVFHELEASRWTSATFGAGTCRALRFTRRGLAVCVFEGSAEHLNRIVLYDPWRQGRDGRVVTRMLPLGALAPYCLSLDEEEEVLFMGGHFGGAQLRSLAEVEAEATEHP